MTISTVSLLRGGGLIIEVYWAMFAIPAFATLIISLVGNHPRRWPWFFVCVLFPCYINRAEYVLETFKQHVSRSGYNEVLSGKRILGTGASI